MIDRRSGRGRVVEVGPPPTAEQFAELRKAAKRGRYRSNLRLARALYATGLGRNRARVTVGAAREGL